MLSHADSWQEVEEPPLVAPSPHRELREKLLQCVRYGDTLELRGLIRRGAPLDTACPEIPGGKGNLVDWALHHRRPDIASRLLRLAGDRSGVGGVLARTCHSGVYVAALSGFVELLELLLERGADPCQRGASAADPSGTRSALLAAAAHGRADVVGMLVTAGAMTKEPRQAEVRHLAESGGFFGALGIEQSCTLPTGPPMEKTREALQEAILAEDRSRINKVIAQGALLLPHYRNDKACPRVGQHRGGPEAYVTGNEASRHASLVNPVDWAALENRPQAALWLLDLGDWAEVAGNLDPVHDRVAPGTRHAVHVAAKRGSSLEVWRRLLKELLGRGADSGQLDPWGRSALHLAVINGNADAVQDLLTHGAWEREQQPEEVLRAAIARRIDAVIEIAGAAPDASLAPAPPSRVLRGLDASVVAATPRACSGGDVPAPAVGERAHSFRDVQTQQELEETRLRLRKDLIKAVRWSDLAAVRALLLRGAILHPVEVDLGYGIRGNLIDWAVMNEHEVAAAALLELGDERGVGGELATGAQHAVFWAVRHNFVALLRALLERGADPAQRDEVCGSALRAAVEQSRPEAVSALLAAGAWEREAEQDVVLELIRDKGLLAPLQQFSGRGTGLGDEQLRLHLMSTVSKTLAPDQVETVVPAH